jgi:hypothetical protein
MDLSPPHGSKISIAEGNGDPTVVIPAASGFNRYFIGLFLLFWLGMWQMGFRDALAKVLAGNAPAFLIFWLCAWTVGGVGAAFALFRIVRPTVPETLALGRNSVAYDSGVAPPEFNSYKRSQNPVTAWRSAFPKRLQADLDRTELQTLRLRETEAGNRLTIDVEGQRIEIARAASEVEREWLAKLLARRYSLTQVSGNTGAPTA